MDAGFFVTALLVSLAAAFAASLMYRFFYERRGTGSQVHRAFPLLSLAITTLFIGVQLSIPLSLGLLGSLSIIRFRTPVKEPEEVGFIMLVIASSICAATDNFPLILLLHAMAFASLVVARWIPRLFRVRRDGVLVVTLDGAAAPERARAIEPVLKRSLAFFRLESATAGGQTSSWQWAFDGLRVTVPELQIAIREAAEGAVVNVYLDRPGGLR